MFKGKNPEQLVMDMLQNNNICDPTIVQLIEYAKSGDSTSLTKAAESIFASQGKDFNAEFQNFMSMVQ